MAVFSVLFLSGVGYLKLSGPEDNLGVTDKILDGFISDFVEHYGSMEQDRLDSPAGDPPRQYEESFHYEEVQRCRLRLHRVLQREWALLRSQHHPRRVGRQNGA